MPGRLKVRILAGRHLPIMDRASDLTDAFVEVKFGSTTYKTEVYAKSLNPHWNSDWFKFEVDDELLQDEPLQVRVLDHDTYSSHDVIGKVYIDVDPLLDPESSHQLGGWFPIFDTMHGGRIPECYRILRVHGFVHDLLVEEDPEYKWIEKLRTPRASNEARQRLFSKMSGELQRRIGGKVELMGGNAVIGFQQSYDIEGDSGIVVRGIGTAVTIDAPIILRKRPPTLAATSEAGGSTKEIPFYTLTSIPGAALRRLSMVVCARAVKLLEKVHNQEEHETRELWWSEIRQEVKGHCLALACNAVVGYTEHTSICDDVIVLSGHGSAVDIDPDMFDDDASDGDTPRNASPTKSSVSLPSVEEIPEGGEKLDSYETKRSTCRASLFQVLPDATERIDAAKYLPSPSDPNILVPQILLATIDVPPNIDIVGEGTFVQARFCRGKKKNQNEAAASTVSDALPFIEYEVQRRLCNKIKIRGMNALFRYSSRITIGENLIVGVASGTAVCLAALPRPSLRPDANKLSNPQEKMYLDFSEKCKKRFRLHDNDDVKKDEREELGSFESSSRDNFVPDKKRIFVEMENMSDEPEDVAIMLMDVIPPDTCNHTNLDICPGMGGEFSLVQSFSTLWRVRYDGDASDEELNKGISSSFIHSLCSLYFRMKRISPSCVFTALNFHISIPDDDELQIWISGAVLAPKEDKQYELEESRLSTRTSSDLSCDPQEDSDPFLGIKKPTSFIKPVSPILRRIRRVSASGGRSRYDSSSSTRARHFSDSNSSDIEAFELSRPPERIETTAMSSIPGRAVKRHVGALNIFIVRETSAIRGADEMIPGTEPVHGTGSCWFVTRTLAETQALIRAHVVALGGNALTSYRTSYSVFYESLAKNEAQCLLHVCGDVVEVT